MKARYTKHQQRMLDEMHKAVKYIKEFPGLQANKMHFLLEEIGLSETEYLEALNRASNGELVRTALYD